MICVALGGREAHRLFDEHVLAGFQRRDRRFGMQIRRQADIDEVDRLVGQQIVEVACISRRRIN